MRTLSTSELVIGILSEYSFVSIEKFHPSFISAPQKLIISSSHDHSQIDRYLVLTQFCLSNMTGQSNNICFKVVCSLAVKLLLSFKLVTDETNCIFFI